MQWQQDCVQAKHQQVIVYDVAQNSLGLVMLIYTSTDCDASINQTLSDAPLDMTFTSRVGVVASSRSTKNWT